MMNLKELGSVCDLQNGYAFKSKDYIEKSNTVSLRMSNIRPGGNFDNDYNLRYLPDNFQEKYSNYIVKNGDLVIAMTDLANDPKILGIPTIVETGNKTWLLNQRAGKLIVKDDSKADKNYLRYILNHPIHRNYYKMFAGGGLQINVGKKEILGCKIPLPPLSTQKRIAEILDNAAALRDKTQQLLTEYDQLAQSIFLDMFGDPVTNPKGWELTNFNNVLILRRGFDLPVKSRKNGEYPVMASNGIIDYHNDYKVSGPGIITGRSGTLGKVHLIEKNYWPLNTSLYSVDLKGNNPIFLLYLLKNFKVERFSRGAGVPTLNRNLVHSEKIMKIEIQLQNQFAEKIALIEQQKDLAKQELQESEDLFQALLQKAFKGELN